MKFLIKGKYDVSGAKGLIKEGGTARKATVTKIVSASASDQATSFTAHRGRFVPPLLSRRCTPSLSRRGSNTPLVWNV